MSEIERMALCRGGVYLAVGVRLVLGLLVVKVLEVLVDGDLLAGLVLLAHGSEATGGLVRVAVEDLLELGIALVVLLLELDLRLGTHLCGLLK